MYSMARSENSAWSAMDAPYTGPVTTDTPPAPRAPPGVAPPGAAPRIYPTGRSPVPSRRGGWVVAGPTTVRPPRVGPPPATAVLPPRAPPPTARRPAALRQPCAGEG